MELVDKIIRAKWLITCEEKNSVLEDYALIIKNGKILDILPFKNIVEKYSAKENID